MVDSAQESRPSQSESREHKKWTVMVYMVAGEDTDLDAVAVHDLREMERGANEHAHVVVQINRAWPKNPQLYEIRNGCSVHCGDSRFTNMAKGEALGDFLKWTVPKFPAEHYCLVLWGHAYGLGFGRDHNDPLTLQELTGALNDFRRARQGGQVLDLLGANACALSYVEAAYELRESARYMVASQISVPFAGWPYESILKRIEAGTDPEALGRLIAETYVSFYNTLVSGERVAMSLLSLSEVSIFQSAVAQLARAIRDALRPDGGEFSSIRQAAFRDVFIAAAAGDVRPLLDLEDLVSDLSLESKSLSSAVNDVRLGLTRVVKHHARHPDLDGLHGLGIFAPFVTDEEDLRRLDLAEPTEEEPAPGALGKTAYSKLALFAGREARADWPSLVYDDLRREVAPELLTGLGGIDATQRQVRRDVTQIALSIESTFNKLDRVVATAREEAVETLQSAAKSGQARGAGPSASDRSFGFPWLKLVDWEERGSEAATVRRRLTAGAPESRFAPTGFAQTSVTADLEQGTRVAAAPDAATVTRLVDILRRVETAVGEVERATRKGLTNSRLGLGPVAPRQFNFEPPKSGLGEQPKSGLGAEPPKSGLGAEPPKSGLGLFPISSPGGDLRIDLAFSRVSDLFRQVAEALFGLEAATATLESRVERIFGSFAVGPQPAELREAMREQLKAEFNELLEVARTARITVRRVLLHPVYGLGPGSDGLGIDERQILASGAGLDRRILRLL